jgi:tetratricopeptide (TPR) repeat protein
VWFCQGVWHAERNEYLAARHALQRGLDLASRENDEEGIANCLEQLAWLETEAFNHHEAIRVAALALDAARDDWQRARALDARANARHRLHEHRAARADLLRAAEAYALADDDEWAKNARRRADGDRLLHLLHQFPTWVFRDRDMSTREAAFRKQFQPLYWWVVGIVFVWPLVGAGLAGLVPRGGWRVGLAVASLAPMLLLGVLIIVGAVLTKRNDRRDRSE